MSITPAKTDLLLVVDVQNDFLPGGNLPVAEGQAVIPVINKLGERFCNVVATQDWHPPGHLSFASSHADRAPFETITLPYGTQTLWPDHCVQGSPGAALAHDLKINHTQLIIRKGSNPAIDSYSAFLEADRRTSTGLAGYLRERGITRVFLVGLATDFCVSFSALDAAAAGFKAVVIEDACRAIDLNGSLRDAWARMKQAGVERLTSEVFGVRV